MDDVDEGACEAILCTAWRDIRLLSCMCLCVVTPSCGEMEFGHGSVFREEGRVALRAVGLWAAAFLVASFTLRGADALLAVASGRKDKAKLLLAACCLLACAKGEGGRRG